MILEGNITGKNNTETTMKILKSTSYPKFQKEKIQRIYEDDDFIIDLFPEEPMVRVSIFEDCHFKDEVIIRKSDYCD